MERGIKVQNFIMFHSWEEDVLFLREMGVSLKREFKELLLFNPLNFLVDIW